MSIRAAKPLDIHPFHGYTVDRIRYTEMAMHFIDGVAILPGSLLHRPERVSAVKGSTLGFQRPRVRFSEPHLFVERD